MAQFQHLPIYKQTYDVLLRTMSATKDFPREYKYTLGQKIVELIALDAVAKDGKIDLSKIQIEGVIVKVLKDKFPPQK